MKYNTIDEWAQARIGRVVNRNHPQKGPIRGPIVGYEIGTHGNGADFYLEGRRSFYEQAPIELRKTRKATK